MLRKIMASVLLICFSFTASPPFVFAVDDELKLFLMQGMETTKAKKADETRYEDQQVAAMQWKTFTCPICEKEFQIPISSLDEETSKGLKEIICPYDGTKFIPRDIAMRQALKEEPSYTSLVSPFERKEFKTKMSTESITAGMVITDPYSGKKFRYVPQLIKPGEEWREVVNPGDGKKFRVRFFPQEYGKELSSPYDGSRISPEEQIVSEKDKLSDIEKMFSREIPISVSKSIKQFGYEIFPKEPQIKKLGEKSKKELGEIDTSENLTDKQQGNMSLLEKTLFEKNGLSQFEEGLYGTSSAIPVSDDYILGPGDKLIIDIWGNIQQKLDLDVDGEGKIILPQAGPLNVWGLKFGEAKKIIEENLRKYYTNFQISISIGKLRSIKVFVLGEAKQPGAYTVSSISTLFSVLYQVAGPTKIGSLRKIKLTRANKTEEIVDLYPYLLEGSRAGDFKLEGDDVIFIPPIGGVVGIAGNVKRPAVYEIKNGIPLSELLVMSGGISAVGYLQRIQVERIQDHQRKVVFDLEFENMQALQNSSSNIILQDGDLVLISAVTPIKHNYVSVEGCVQRAGDYELKPAMKLKDLIDEAEGIMPGTYLERAELSRFRDDKTREILPVNLGRLLSGSPEENIELKEWDRLYIFTKSEVVPTFFISIDGAVYKPGEYELTDNMRISDLIFRAGGLKKTASLKNAELYRRVIGEEPQVMPIDLSAVFDPRNKENDLYMQEGDQLFIREETKWLGSREILLSGEVVYPGKYIAAPGEKLSSIIKRAGGFTDKAFLPGAVFTRVSVRKYQYEMIKKFISAEQEAMLKEESSLATGLSIAQDEARREMIKYREKQLDALETTELIGRIILKLDSLDKLEGTENDLSLEDGDTLKIPVIPSSVQVVGNVYAPNAITYIEGKGVDYYINRAGGFTKNADKRGIFIIKPSGEAIGKFSSVMKVTVGDTIVIPELFRYKTPAGLILKDAFSFTSQLVVTVLALSAVN